MYVKQCAFLYAIKQWNKIKFTYYKNSAICVKKSFIVALSALIYGFLQNERYSKMTAKIDCAKKCLTALTK